MTENNTTTTTETHSGPHIPTLQGEKIYGPITPTILTTFFFLIIIVILSLLAKSSLKKTDSKLKMFFLNIISFFDNHLVDSFGGDKKFARRYFPLVVWVFFIILFGNLFGLMIDWLGASISSDILQYFRPMHSDLNTTLVLAIITVVMFLGIAVANQGVLKTTKWYLFNFSGHSIWEKIVNVFVGWLHLIWVPATLASLSLRLFGNIFAGIVLLWVITYLGSTISHSFFEVGRFLSLPFWFFEFFVAFVQAVVFAGLMIAYFNQSKEWGH